MIWSDTTTLSPSRDDRLLFQFLRSLSGVVGIIVICIFAFLSIEALPVFYDIGILAFVTDPSWHPTEHLFNLAPMVLGTLLVSVGAMLIATPLGILLALFCEYYAPANIARLYQKFIELLAGIPSVVYGFWGLIVLVPFIAKLHPPGSSLLAGILVLTIMILPIGTLVSQTAFQQVPKEYTQNAIALGLTRWSIIRHIILPTSRPGILTGIILQTGRALGETMAILMVCGNVVQYPIKPIRPHPHLDGEYRARNGLCHGDPSCVSFFLRACFSYLLPLGLVMLAQRINIHHVYR